MKKYNRDERKKRYKNGEDWRINSGIALGNTSWIVLRCACVYWCCTPMEPFYYFLNFQSVDWFWSICNLQLSLINGNWQLIAINPFQFHAFPKVKTFSMLLHGTNFSNAKYNCMNYTDEQMYNDKWTEMNIIDKRKFEKKEVIIIIWKGNSCSIFHILFIVYRRKCRISSIFFFNFSIFFDNSTPSRDDPGHLFGWFKR